MSGERPWRVKRREHKCPVCGRVISLTGKEVNWRQLVSCGDAACTSRLLARGAVSKLKLHDRPDEWEAARKQGHHDSPLSGPHPENVKAKEWRLIDPFGDLWEFRNLKHFIREHPELFAAEDTVGEASRAVTGIGKIRPDREKPKRSWKGWTWAECPPMRFFGKKSASPNEEKTLNKTPLLTDTRPAVERRGS